MKRLLFLLLLTTQTVWAQKKSFIPQVQLGFSATQVEGDAYGGFNKVGLVGSFGVQRSLNDDLSFGISIQFAQRGSVKRADTKNGDFESYRMRLFYVDVPIELVYNIDKIQLKGGLTWGTLLANKEFDSNGALANRPEFNNFDVNGFLGIRYFVSSKFFAELNVGHSLIPIRNLVEGPSSFSLSNGQYNYWIYTTFGMRIGK